MTVGLVLICKNEQAVIGRCLESVIPIISTWTIVDTGSTDGTQDIVSDVLGDMEGALHERPWVSFGHNKTEALALAQGTADRMLILDADMTVQGTLQGPLPRADQLMLTVRDGSDFEYRLPLLLNGRKHWRYEGVTHEYLTCAEPTTRANLDTLTVTHHCDGARRPEKLLQDLTLLADDFAHNPDDPRTAFYLAQTYRDLGMIEQAISLYRLRANMPGWDEETYYARYQLGCLLATHVSFAQGADELLQAWRERPTRIESLRALANSANAVADKATMPEDALFLHTDQYATPGQT